MIHRVYEQVSRSQRIDQVVVATDDERIFTHVQGFGGEARMTRSDHASGTDRCAEVARKFRQARIIVNIQGDEPFIFPEQIDLLVNTLLRQPKFPIATLAKSIENQETLFDPNIVKVVFSEKTGALYFSRQPIPFVRNSPPEKWLTHSRFYKHIGLYGFRRAALLRVSQLPISSLEQAESLEQLRWLENGFRIAVGQTNHETLGIDTPADLERAKRHLYF